MILQGGQCHAARALVVGLSAAVPHRHLPLASHGAGFIGPGRCGFSACRFMPRHLRQCRVGVPLQGHAACSRMRLNCGFSAVSLRPLAWWSCASHWHSHRAYSDMPRHVQRASCSGIIAGSYCVLQCEIKQAQLRFHSARLHSPGGSFILLALCFRVLSPTVFHCHSCVRL